MKTWKQWKLGIGTAMATLALIAAATACSSSGGKGSTTGSSTGGSGGAGTTSTGSAAWSCSAKGLCPNDQAPSASDIQDCQSSLSDPDCGSAFRAQAVCNFSNAVCDDAGTSEPSESCKSADVAWANCMLGDAGTD